MKNSLPFFPLNIVVFPGEQLNLHVFEPRYIELLKDCILNKSNFCIPSYVNNKIEYGTEVRLLEVDKNYDDGRADIKTVGERVVKIERMNNPFEDKLYAVGEVTFLENRGNGDKLIREKLKVLLLELFELIEVDNVNIDDDFSVFDVGHKIGLSKELEYEL
ncbi:MAG: Lon protease-like protein, partial [Marivirga sp.]